MKKLSSIIISSLVAFSIIPTIASASSIPRDPNGDGNITMADRTYIAQFLEGEFIPNNLTQLDFDQNGVISLMDAYKVQIFDSRNQYYRP